MLKVGIIGASGYTGAELLRLLLRHPGVDLDTVTSERYDDSHVSDLYTSLRDITDLKFNNIKDLSVIDDCDLVFTALPHGASLKIISKLHIKGKKVIDLSADFRLKDPLAYEKYYDTVHSDTALLAASVYGLPELYKEAIKGALLIANPGCYPTSIILGLAPLVSSELKYNGSIVIDSKSGISGAGRKADLKFNYCETAENLFPYSIFSHRHVPEIEQELDNISKKGHTVIFAPHIVPVKRGMLSTIYLELENPTASKEILGIYRNYYQESPYVRILEEGKAPSIKGVIGSNYCDIGLFLHNDRKKIVIVSAIDNLIKGASGQAVQNMNIMFGLDETLGIDQIGIYP